jgi:transposase
MQATKEKSKYTNYDRLIVRRAIAIGYSHRKIQRLFHIPLATISKWRNETK